MYFVRRVSVQAPQGCQGRGGRPVLRPSLPVRGANGPHEPALAHRAPSLPEDPLPTQNQRDEESRAPGRTMHNRGGPPQSYWAPTSLALERRGARVHWRPPREGARPPPRGGPTSESMVSLHFTTGDPQGPAEGLPDLPGLSAFRTGRGTGRVHAAAPRVFKA